jgi:manganese oxidase
MRRVFLSLGVLVSVWVCSPAPAAQTSGSALGSSGDTGQTHTYYIAADEVRWDYVPGGMDGIVGGPFKATGFFQTTPDGPPAARPVSTAYVKALYREYTDNSFKTLKPRPPEWEHLGFLGPLVRAEVGDTIRIVFRNNGDRPYSMHPHGVFYEKDSEGAPYNDGTSGKDKADDAVPPGRTHEYVWQVPERAGPASGDLNSVMWLYHSHTDELRDPSTGLMGAMIITGRGQSKPDGTPKGIDREFVTMFAQVHEENSWYVGRNLPTLATEHPLPGNIANPVESQDIYPYFVTFSINGFAHGSMPLKALTMKKGEHVRWYVFSSTNDFDFHTPHWHGNTVVVNQMRTDVTFMAPMQMITADMVPDDTGTWLLHCHVSFHNSEGMNVRYAVN